MATPTVDRTTPDLEESGRLREFWDEHYKELLKEYPEQFVAVKDGHVVASHGDLVMLVYELRSRGLDARTDVAIEFISANAGNLLL